MSDNLNKTVEQLLMEQIEAQRAVLEATERRVKAETEAAMKAQEAIDKHKEAIAIATASKNASDRLITSIEKLIIDVQGTIIIAKPLEQVIGKIDILIQILQLLVQIVNQLNGVSKENLDKLQDQLFRLAELNAMAAKGITIQQSSSTVGQVDAQQANIAKNINAIKREINGDKLDKKDEMF